MGFVSAQWCGYRLAFCVPGSSQAHQHHDIAHRAIVARVRYQWRCLWCPSTWQRQASGEWGSCQHKRTIEQRASETKAEAADAAEELLEDLTSGASDIRPVAGSRPKKLAYRDWPASVRLHQRALQSNWDEQIARYRSEGLLRPTVRPCICGAHSPPSASPLSAPESAAGALASMRVSARA